MGEEKKKSPKIRFGKVESLDDKTLSDLIELGNQIAEQFHRSGHSYSVGQRYIFTLQQINFRFVKELRQMILNFIKVQHTQCDAFLGMQDTLDRVYDALVSLAKGELPKEEDVEPLDPMRERQYN